MNIKAIYYALSRMILPTITVIILALMWSLSPTKTFSFLLSEGTWAGILRIILMLAEVFWFYYLYSEYSERDELNKEKTEGGDIRWVEESPYRFEDLIKNKWKNSNYYYKYLPKNDIIIIKGFPKA